MRTPKNVSAVLGEQKRAGNDEKAEQDKPCSRSQKACLEVDLDPPEWSCM